MNWHLRLRCEYKSNPQNTKHQARQKKKKPKKGKKPENPQIRDEALIFSASIPPLGSKSRNNSPNSTPKLPKISHLYLKK